MSVLDNVVSEAGGNHKSLIEEINEYYVPDDGREVIVLSYKDRYPVTDERKGLYVERIRQYIRNSTQGMWNVSYAGDPKDSRSFYIWLSLASHYPMREYLDKIKQYLIPSTSVELVKIDIINDRDSWETYSRR